MKYRYRLGYETLCGEVSDSLTWLRFCRIPIGERAPNRSLMPLALGARKPMSDLAPRRRPRLDRQPRADVLPRVGEFYWPGIEAGNSLMPMETASAHLMVAVGADSHGVLDQARQLLQERYAIDHATLQVEPADHSGCDAVAW